MNKQDTIKVIATIQTAYPNFNKDAESKELNHIINLWQKMFAGDDIYIVGSAIERYILTNKFPPTIADIRFEIARLKNDKEITEGDAWNILLRTIKQSGYSDYQLWQGLPKPIKEITSASQIHDWGQMPIDEINSVVQSNFLRAYRQKQKQENENKMLTEKAKETQKKISEMCRLKEIGD